MKSFMNNMTQISTHPPGWIASILLHIGVFFALLNTPILKQYPNPSSFFTFHLINTETSLTKMHEGATPNERVANQALPKITNNKLLPRHPLQQPTQENFTFKQLDKKNLASIQEELRDGKSGKNQTQNGMSILPKRKPKEIVVINKAKLERVNRRSNNTTFTATQSEEIASNNPFDRKNSKEATSVIPSGKKPDKKLTNKPLINLPTKNNLGEKVNVRETTKISSSTGTDDFSLGNESVSPVWQELPLPLKRNLPEVSTAEIQKSGSLNKRKTARPKVGGPHVKGAPVDNYEKSLKKPNTLTSDLDNKLIENEKSDTFPTRIMGSLSNAKIFNNEPKSYQSRASSIKQNKNFASDVQILVNKDLLKTWGASVRNDVVKRTLGSKLSRDIKIVLKISKNGELLTLKIVGPPRIDKNIENFISTIKTSGNFPSAPDGLKLDYVNFPISFRSSG